MEGARLRSMTDSERECTAVNPSTFGIIWEEMKAGVIRIVGDISDV